MLGKNEVTKPFRVADGKLLVNEIWYTIQGEGPDAGRPAVFIRLSKCNLRCYFCDTEFESGKPMTVDEVYHKVCGEILHRQHCNLVVITGGEPLLQNIVPLVRMLNLASLSVSVETAGTVWCPGLDAFFNDHTVNKIVCSPKTAGINRELLPLIKAWKYIVCMGGISEHDGLPVWSTQHANVNQQIYRPKKHPAPIFVQPMWVERDELMTKANMSLAAEICMRYGYRLSLQGHKIVGVP